MDAPTLDNRFAFPDLATRALNENEIHSDTLNFPPPSDEPLGVFRGLVAATLIEIACVLLLALGWQFWRFLR